MSDLFRNYIYPVATLSGSIVGVGFLSLPYIAMNVGFIPMLFYFVILTTVVTTLHVIVAEISLETPDFKRFPGFVGYYLGEWSERFTLVLWIIGSIGVRLVYLLIGSQFLAAILVPVFGGTILQYAILYFAISSIFIFVGIKAISRAEFWIICLLVLSLLLIFIKGFPYFHISNLFIGNWSLGSGNFFLPYGAILFSLWGTGLVPEVEEMLRGRKRSLKKVVIIATVLPAIFYVLFTVLVLGITGAATTESALIGLKGFLGNGVMALALFVGILGTFNGMVSSGLLMNKVLAYDMKIASFPAWVFTCFPPLILFLMGFNSFIPLIAFIGGVLLGVEGILVVLIYQKLKHWSPATYLLSLIFILGIVYEIYYFL